METIFKDLYLDVFTKKVENSLEIQEDLIDGKCLMLPFYLLHSNLSHIHGCART
jgi:hypothetical protein